MRIFSSFFLLFLSIPILANSTVLEGVIEKAEVINTEVGKDGKPLAGAAVGLGIGSVFGSGGGKDVAKILGAIVGATSQAKKSKKVIYGWRYIIKTGTELHVVDKWCPETGEKCSGFASGKSVYLINGDEVTER